MDSGTGCAVAVAVPVVAEEVAPAAAGAPAAAAPAPAPAPAAEATPVELSTRKATTPTTTTPAATEAPIITGWDSAVVVGASVGSYVGCFEYSSGEPSSLAAERERAEKYRGETIDRKWVVGRIRCQILGE